MLGGAGLAAAALVGCGSDDDDDDTVAAPDQSTSTTDDGAATGATGAATGATGAAGDTVVAVGELVQDPSLPYPYQFPEPAKEPKPGGVLNVGVTWDVVTFDPTKSAAGGTITVPNVVYNRLLGFVGGPRYSPFNLELEPELASSWERTPDGTSFTFNLRDDVKWHNVDPLNGRPFVADDVKFAYDRYATDGVHQSIWDNVSSIEAADNTTLRINMGTVTADFIASLGGRYQTIFPRELVDDGSIDQKAVGTGPMIMTEAEAGSKITFEKNPDYWEREVLLDGMEFRVIVDAAARLAAFRVGQLDYGYAIGDTASALKDVLRTNPDVQVNFAPLTQSWSFGINLSNPKYQDARVRQALTLAIDKPLIRELVFDNQAKSLHQQPWDYVWDEEPSVENGILGKWNPRFDPAEARKLLASAGASDLSMDSIHYVYGTYITQWTEILISNFKDVGVELNPKSVDYTEFNSTWVPAQLDDATTSGWGAAGFDADNYYYNQLHSRSPGNRWKLNDPQIDEWADAQRSELDPEARKAILQSMWNHMLEEMYFPPLASAINTSVYQPWVRNLRFGGPAGSSSYYYDWGDQIAGVWLDK
ncbi:MAG: ABC transporter substrate-binding protein [Chloroflexi bacterium]|nr:ABC transporter substrate-binding protein [Chloroflexota bacterium]